MPRTPPDQAVTHISSSCGDDPEVTTYQLSGTRQMRGFGHNLSADCHGVHAPWVERAARRRVSGAAARRGHGTPASATGIGPGTAASRAGCRGARGCEHRRPGVLHDPAEVHHRHPVGDVLHHRQVVRDEQVGQPELLLQVLQQVQDLGLDRHVERRDRLVAAPAAGVRARWRGRCRCAGAARRRTRAGSGRRRPASAPRARAAPRPASRRRAASPMPCMRPARRAIAPTVMRGSSEPYGSWNTICMSRRSRRSARGDSARHVRAVEAHRAGGRLEQPQDRARRRRLAAAGLAHQAERLAARHLEATPSTASHRRPPPGGKCS